MLPVAPFRAQVATARCSTTDLHPLRILRNLPEPTIRDVPVLLELAPGSGVKHRDNTLTLKTLFSSGVGFCASAVQQPKLP
ncbi:hypothetical protein KCP73_23700 [Salmonella enterica subsp. enterica]|nr:hypothetical protein KCP73_23700 [Salmonella enterica subsp. enterica]